MFGLKIIQHALAVHVRYEWRVEAHPIRKRRRNWRVVKHRIVEPGVYQIGDTIYAHPEIVEKLRSVGHNAAMRGSPASSATPLDGTVMQKEN